jgi:hypothetical protein
MKSVHTAFLYFHAMLALAQDPNGPCFEYKVDMYRLLFVILLIIFNPLIYTLELEDMEDAYNGFVHKGRTQGKIYYFRFTIDTKY